MGSAYISVLIGGLIGSMSTLLGSIISHQFTRNRDRRAVALQGLRELAVVRLRMQRRDALEFEADLATIQYQWAIAGISARMISIYLFVARHGASVMRAGQKPSDDYFRLLAELDNLMSAELAKPSRGRQRARCEQVAKRIAGTITSEGA